MLSPEQVMTFHVNGFMQETKVLDDKTVEELCVELDKVISGDSEGRPVLMRDLSQDGERPVLQVLNIWKPPQLIRDSSSIPRWWRRSLHDSGVPLRRRGATPD
jgi:hypothetical protein